MLQSEKGKLERQVLQGVQEALQNWWFPVIALMFLAVAEVIDKYAHALEGCVCHKDIWTSHAGYKTRAKRVREDTGATHSPYCIWKGRQSPWWVVIGLAACLDDVMHATSDGFEDALRGLAEERRTKVVTWMSNLRSKLHEVIQDKMALWKQIPWRLMGAFYSCITPGPEAVAASKKVLKECLTLYDVAIFEGTFANVHRVAKLLLDSGKACGRELRQWLESDLPLQAFTAAYCGLLEYVLIPLVERRIEAEHAKLKKIGKASTYVLPATLCALLREPANLLLLKNVQFVDHCVQMWHRHNIADLVLHARRTREELKTMTVTQKVKAIYQCDIRSMFEDTSVAKRNHDDWILVCPSACGVVAPKLSAEAKAIKQFVKSIFVAGEFFSLPVALFNKWRNGEIIAVEGGYTSLAVVLERATMAQPVLPEHGVEELIYFRVENNAPETRHYVHVPHLASQRSSLNVSICVLISTKDEGTSALVRKGTTIIPLDVLTLMRDLDKYLPFLFKTRIGQAFTSVQARLAPAALPVMPIVNLAVGQAAPDEHAVVPVAANDDDPLHSPSALAYCLSQLVWKGGMDAEVPISSLGGVCAATLGKCMELGLVDSRTDEFLEQQVAINSRSVLQTPIFALVDSTPVHRIALYGKLWKLPKVYLMVRLHEVGWTAGEPTDPFELTSPFAYHAKVSRPIMYFVALILAADIFDKGVESIKHNGTHLYYSVLVHSPADKIMGLLARLEGEPNAVKTELHELEDESESDSSDSDIDRRRRCARANPDPHAGLAIVPHVDDRVPWWNSEWRRTVVTIGAETAKVYFDNESAGSGRRRGWCDCSLHGCGCIRPVRESRNFFAVWCFLWKAHGATDPHMTRSQHLKFSPSDEAVRAAMPSATFADF